jgi:hypothetical protein
MSRTYLTQHHHYSSRYADLTPCCLGQVVKATLVFHLTTEYSIDGTYTRSKPSSRSDTTLVTLRVRPVQRNGEQRLTMRRVPPIFPPSIWSVHSATVDSDPRTNNVGEGWNNKFFTLVGMVSTRTRHSPLRWTGRYVPFLQWWRIWCMLFPLVSQQLAEMLTHLACCRRWNNKFFTLVGMVSTRTRHSYTAKRHWHPTNKENQPEASAVTETTTEPV